MFTYVDEADSPFRKRHLVPWTARVIFQTWLPISEYLEIAAELFLLNSPISSLLPALMAALTTTNFPALKLLSKGKVRDVYATSSPDHLLVVATDRISAYDVILRNVRPHPCSLSWTRKMTFCSYDGLLKCNLCNCWISTRHTCRTKGVPGKGKILTQLSLFWFDKLKHVIPTHFVASNIDEMPEEVKQYKEQLEGRTMLVKKATVIPLEAIVRGYITGIFESNIL